jgi:predicted RNase H-like HicB family nuclease
MHAQYVCTFRPDPEGGYAVRRVGFPKLVSDGNANEDARATTREALKLCLAAYRDEARPIPAPRLRPAVFWSAEEIGRSRTSAKIRQMTVEVRSPR